MRANRAAFGRWRSCRGCCATSRRATRRSSCSAGGSPRRSCSRPIGVLELAHRDADRAVAARRGERGRADGLLEPGLDADGGGRRGARRQPALVPALLEHLERARREPRLRAERCGCEAIVVTLDTTMLGWRTRDLDIAYLPFLRGMGIAQYTSDPVFQRLVEEAAGADQDHGPCPTPSATCARCSQLTALRRRFDLRAARERGRALHPDLLAAVAHLGRPARSCASARSCRSCSRASCTPTTRAGRVDAGMDGLVVSNHGGRQVDGSIGDARRAAGRRRGGRRPDPVLLDSGVRGGADVVQGARARRDARSCSAGPTSTAWRSRAARACARCCATSWPTST